ncbi:hypothetical protein Bcp1_159 [Bacillus phage Bcp1]|uniref:Uncharacterized protein n=1 Tax=Bacillus phage Bcp1 TaxID=584892 RepID=X2JIX3_9CAUD|nr:hypothetical protein Bcp1_159 [Bacillus phage Bcp1]AHN66634.1 hypothetical protein Bcp1_159 [Bacillus phage Bcp1]
MKTTATLNTDQLQVVWEQLDGACEAVERLQENGISTGSVDFSSLVSLKNEVEELIQAQGKKLSFKDIVETNKIPFNLEAVKRELNDVIDGRFMVRQYKGYRMLDKQGISTYYVYFDNPSPKNKDGITVTLEALGLEPTKMRITSGSYGYIIAFKVKEEGK